jgi:hypothetical protein
MEILSCKNFFQDEKSHATKEEILNGYPTLQLVLNPGGCAGFLFPVSGGQQNFFLTPGRKDGDVSLTFVKDLLATFTIQFPFKVYSSTLHTMFFNAMCQGRNCM